MGISWPRICCGCGSAGPVLKAYAYKWMEIESVPVGRTFSPSIESNVDIHAALCPACLARSKSAATTGWKESLTLLLLTTAIAAVISSAYRSEPVVFVCSFLFLDTIPLILAIGYFTLRAQPFLYYMGIKTSPWGKILVLKNADYLDAFKRANPAIRVTYNPEYSPAKVRPDGNAIMTSIVFFGCIFPAAVFLVLRMLGLG